MDHKVMIVEDQEEIQLLYKTVFRKHPNLKIVAQEDNAESALQRIPDLNPDLIIIDVSLPGMTGLELTRKIHENYPYVKIIVVTAFERDNYLNIAKEAGANNLVTKTNFFQIVDEVEKMLK